MDSGSGSQETQREGSQPEAYQLDNAAVDASGQETFLPDSFNDRHPQLNCSYLNASDPPIRLDVLTNKTLLSMLQAWQDVIDEKRMQYALEHPRFQELMTELLERDVISADWKWALDVEEVDMAFTRVVVESRSL